MNRSEACIIKTVILCAAGLTLSSPAFAQNEESQLAPDEEGTAQATGRADIIVFGKSYGAAVGKTVTPLKDVPNTITVMDREQIELQGLFTLEDAMTAIPGITVTGVGSEGASFLSRGFTINNYLIDGTPTMSFDFPAIVPDLFFYERMEVLRGPAGLFSGSGNPAGSINMVRKRPLDHFQVKAAGSAGSYNNFRGEIDVSMPLAPGVAVRAGAMLHDQDQFYDIAHRNRLSAFATGQIDLGDRTTFTAGVTYERFKPAIQTGLPGIAGGADGSDGQLLDVPRSTYLGADWNRFRSDNWTAFADITHELTDRWKLRASGLFTDIDRVDIYSYIGSQPITAANGGRTSHIAYRGDTVAKTYSADVNLTGSFSLFGLDQSLIVGADYQKLRYTQYYTRLSGYAFINVYDPVSPAEPPLNPFGPSVYYPVQGTNATCPDTSVPQVPAPANCVLQVWGGSNSGSEQYGIYGQLRLSPVDGFTLVGGGRLTWWDTDSTPLAPTPGATTRYGFHGRFTPYLGAVWDATDQLNFYASYADSFSPQSSANPRADGEPIEPLIGAQYEIGTKLSLFGDRLLLSLAGYQITQSNRIFSDPDVPNVIYQIGKTRSRGIEAEVHGEILPGWSVNGGYSYTRTKYLEDTNQLLEGVSFVPVIPHHSFKAFTNYAPASGPLEGFSIGGGFTWFSETWGGNAATYNADGTLRTVSTIVRQGNYAVLDLRAGYKVNERLAFSVNVNNALDRTYYARISATGRGNFYASPRTILATVRFTFP